MGEYSWGSATLACLYSRICHISHASTTTTGGPYLFNYYREHIALLCMDEFVWMPYSDERLAALPRYCRRGKCIWLAKVPLVF
ncbi:unnamed protein product [Coffea canephora]|uniref:Aminotransferase-like plant mobile domain-containing protein n=1 Tax=Coffea canephora TaxID=49390 RepID=A0A068V5E0_COFCA|nr:unnamed protein product [Coffea canephora]